MTAYWTASVDGIRHAFRPRRGRTLCGLRVDERWTQPTMPKCATCLELAQEGTRACRR